MELCCARLSADSLLSLLHAGRFSDISTPKQFKTGGATIGCQLYMDPPERCDTHRRRSGTCSLELATMFIEVIRRLTSRYQIRSFLRLSTKVLAPSTLTSTSYSAEVGLPKWVTRGK